MEYSLLRVLRKSLHSAASLVLLFGPASITDLHLTASGQESGLSFLTVGTDAAAVARGDASTASARGAFATYWNPAGLAITGKNEVALSHHIWIDGVKTYALAARFGVGTGSGLGLFITGTDSGELEARDQPGPPTGTFETQFLNFGGSYAVTMGRVRAGITAKYITERIFNDSASGYGIDLGLHASFLRDGLHIGAVLQNLGEMSDLRARATELPRTIRVGTQFFPFRVANGLDGTSLVDISISVDVSHNTVDDNTRIHVGADGQVLDVLIARLGYMSNDRLRGYSAGLGLHIAELTFDYALVPFEDGFDGPAHILSLSYDY